MNKKIKDAILALSTIKNESNFKEINEAIDVLENIIKRASKVVDSCLGGHSQHAEEFAYELSGI